MASRAVITRSEIWAMNYDYHVLKMSVDDIALKFDRSKNAIWKHVIRQTHKRLTGDEKAAISYDYHVKKLSMTRVAKKHGRSVGTIFKLIKKNKTENEQRA